MKNKKLFLLDMDGTIYLTATPCRGAIGFMDLLARTGRLELVWLAFPIAELAALAMSAIFLRKTLRTAERRMADDDYDEKV